MNVSAQKLHWWRPKPEPHSLSLACNVANSFQVLLDTLLVWRLNINFLHDGFIKPQIKTVASSGTRLYFPRSDLSTRDYIFTVTLKKFHILNWDSR